MLSCVDYGTSAFTTACRAEAGELGYVGHEEMPPSAEGMPPSAEVLLGSPHGHESFLCRHARDSPLRCPPHRYAWYAAASLFPSTNYALNSNQQATVCTTTAKHD